VSLSSLELWSFLTMVGVLSAGCAEPAVEVGRIEVLEVLPHDTAAYTQGLVFLDRKLYESTGRYGGSSIRRLDPVTGEVLAIHRLDSMYFGEGLAAVRGRLLQLTWKENVAFLYDPATLVPVDTVAIDTFGWGACATADALLMTSGGSVLQRRDLTTWERVGQVQVQHEGSAVWEVNEMECVPPHVYANIFQGSQIIQFEATSGQVVRTFDLASLVPEHVRGSPDAVPNGIAYDPDSDSFYLTGKLWPVMYRVRLADK
jgi:glutamine cyclotransferase